MEARKEDSQRNLRSGLCIASNFYYLLTNTFDACSEALGDVVQAPKLSRPQVVKQLWVYIKENELQNPSNKREIICDTKLKAVFGVEKIDMFTMNKVLGK